MKLTAALWRWKKPLPRGNIWRGKYKLYKEVTPKILDAKAKQFELEERNMFYLRHPYLTIEQSRGHAQCFNHSQEFIKKHVERKLKNWKDHGLLGDRFGFLKVADRWE